MKRLALYLLLCAVVPLPVRSSELAEPIAVQQPISVQQVLAQMEKRDQARFGLLSQYVCSRRYALNNRRFHKTAELSVRMTCTYPGHKSFEVISEQGLSVIRQRVLKKMLEAEEESSRDGIRETTYIWPRNYNFRLVGTEMQQGRPAFALDISPKKISKFLIRGRIWVDCEDFAIVRVEAAPALKPSAFIHNIHVVQQYAKVGPVWLPLYNRSMSDSFFFGHTDVAIDYTDYRITRKK
jgi:hypothetical protein